MTITDVKIEDIKPYKFNAKKHDKVQIKNVAESIKQFGFVQPIVINDEGTIIIGHCRFEAAKYLKMETVPCLYVENLTEEQIKKLRNLDNKLNESEWDLDLLFKDIEGLDFDGFELDWGQKQEKDKEEEGEVEFSEVLGEEHNYIVLYFDNDIDWINAQSLFDIKNVQCGSTRADGKITKSMKRIGVGRVLKGSDAINKILGGNK